MRAMLLEHTSQISAGSEPLRFTDIPTPVPSAGELLIRVTCCGVCHTEMDEIEGRATPPTLPVIPGHQVIGHVVENRSDSKRLAIGDRVGVCWIFSACGECSQCQSGHENLCPDFTATGKDEHGGYAEYMRVPEAFALPIPEAIDDVTAAPLLCAGAIGYRSMRLAQLSSATQLGFSGFGVSARQVLALVRHCHPDVRCHVFARNPAERQAALDLGADWAGDHGDRPDQLMDCIIDTTPVWNPVLAALECLRPGGRLVINAIRKHDDDPDKPSLAALDYPTHLWLEKEVVSVANITRQDVSEFLALAATIPIQPETICCPLESANEAIVAMKTGPITAARVLTIS